MTLFAKDNDISACVVCCMCCLLHLCVFCDRDDIVCYRCDICASVVCCIYVFFVTEMTLSATDMTFLLVLFVTFLCLVACDIYCLVLCK